jgi:hypothetical protein
VLAHVELEPSRTGELMHGDTHLLVVLLDRLQEMITLFRVRFHYDCYPSLLVADLAWQARRGPLHPLH